MSSVLNNLEFVKPIAPVLQADSPSSVDLRMKKMGDIIVLIGNSTSGKTSIINAVRKIEPERVEDGLDIRKHAIGRQYYKQKFPEQAVTLTEEELLQKSNQLIDSLSESEEAALFANLQTNMIRDIFERSKQGISTILDVLLPVEEIARHKQMFNYNGPLRVVLVYLPFYLLSARIEQRNKEAVDSGNLSEVRAGCYPFMQFAKIYTQKANDQTALETITREQAIKAHDDNFDLGVISARERGSWLPPEEQIPIDKANFRKEFLTDLGFSDDVDSVEIAPRNQQLYDLVLNSGKLSPAESAEILHSSLI